MNKKKIIIISTFMVCFLFFFPFLTVEDEDGTIHYKALVYEVIKYQPLYGGGTKIKVLGFPIYERKENENVLENTLKEKIIKVDNELYYYVPSMMKNFHTCNSEFKEGTIDSHVDLSKIPFKNNQANFEGEYDYQRVNRYVIKICSKDTTMYFERKRTGLKNLDDVLDGKVDIETDYIQDLYNNVNPSTDISILKGLYENVGQFSNTYILSVGIVNWVVEQKAFDEEYINQKDVEDTIQKILGEDVNFKHQDVLVFSAGNYENGICGYQYRKEAKQYQLLHGCGGNWFEFMRRKLVSAEKKGEYLYLKEKSIYLYDDWDDYNSKKYIYNNYNRDKLLDFIETDSSGTYKVTIDKYLDDASTYIYVFKKEKNRCVFEGLQKEA